MNNDYPHTCSICQAPSYNGLNKAECSRMGCANYVRKGALVLNPT